MDVTEEEEVDNRQPGSVLREEFRRQNLRVTEVAEELGIYYTSLSAILNDRKDIGLETSLKLSQKLGLHEELIPTLTMRRKIARIKQKQKDADQADDGLAPTID